MGILDIAKAVSEKARIDIIGIRAGEKIHEQMIGEEDAPYTFKYNNHYKILPMIHDFYKDPLRIKNGVRVSEGFSYRSDNNDSWTKARIASMD